MKRSLFMAAGAVAFAMSGAASTPAQSAQTWVCNIFPGPKHFSHKTLRRWGRMVNKATKGEVKIRFLGANAAPPPKQLDAIVGGTFDCAYIFHAFTAKRASGPAFGILPFINEGNATNASVAYWRTWKKHFGPKQEFKDDGIHILSMFHFAGVHFFTAQSKPILGVADLKNQKVWALAGTSSRTMKALGVNHVSGPAARMAEFTQTKVVQGLAGITREGIIAFAGIGFPKHGTFTKSSMMMPSFAMMVSTKKWNALKPEVQKAVMSVSGENLARMIGIDADKSESAAEKKLAKVGRKSHKAPARSRSIPG